MGIITFTLYKKKKHPTEFEDARILDTQGIFLVVLFLEFICCLWAL